MESNKIVIFEFQDLRFASRARKEAFSLVKNGYNVTLIGFNRKLSKRMVHTDQDVEFIEFGFLSLFKDRFIGKIINIVFLNTSLSILLLKNNFRVYHLHDLKLFFPAILASIVKHKPLIFDAHELHIRKRNGNNFRNKILDKYDELKERVLIRLSKRVIQASDLRADYFANYYNTIKPLVLENHDNITNIDDTVIDIRAKLKLSTKDVILVFTGNISIGSNQRIDNVIKSLEFLPKHIYFCVMGRGSESAKKELREIAKDLQVESRFHFIEPVLSEQVVSTISSADIGVIPIYATSLNSEYSALNKLSQSLMAGLAIVASNYVNMEKVILKNGIGEVGCLFDVESPKSIAEAISKVLKMNLEKLKRRSRNLAEKQLNWEKEEVKLIELYSDLMV